MAYTRKPTPERKHEPKRRKCLRCHAPFMSAWPGERICGKCKATNAWRHDGEFALSMVYGFAKQSGGHVKIESEEGHRTTVLLDLPKGVPPD